VINAIRFENINSPAGHVDEGSYEYLVRVQGEYQNLDEIRNTIITITQSGKPVYIKDIAGVRESVVEVSNTVKIGGKPGIVLFASKRSDANTVKVVDAVKEEMPHILDLLPKDVKFHLFMDQSQIITMMASRTAENALLGAVLAMFLIYYFLRNWRPTSVIAVAIPLSIITTFMAFYAVDYTLNMLTLAGLALGVGMLVDNAVVVIENIFRHLEEGDDRIMASKLGASEVGMAISASTLTTVAVFFPMIFGSGIAGQLSRGMALSVSFSLMASLIIALTVVPMIASILFKARKSKEEYEKAFGETKFGRLKEWYGKFLRITLEHRKTTIIFTTALFLLSLGLIPFIGTEFMPSMDRSMVMLKISLPVGTALDETNAVVNRISEIIKDEAAIETYVTTSGANDQQQSSNGMSASGSHEGMLMLRLMLKDDRDLSSDEFVEYLRKKMPKYRNVKVENLDMSSSMMGGSSTPVDIKVFGKKIPVLRRLSIDIAEKIKDVQGLRDIKTTYEEGKPEYKIIINRDQATRLGLKTGLVADIVTASTVGKITSRYRVTGEEKDIRIKFAKSNRDQLSEIESIPIKNAMGRTIYLNQIAEFIRDEGPTRIDRENQSRRISVTANTAGRDLGSIVSDIQDRIKPVMQNLPPGYFIEIGGQYEEMEDAFITLGQAFLLAILLVYMIMASQFESLSHPFTIMFTIPLAFIGVAIALLVTGNTINTAVIMGFIMLAGIAVNNGIVMVDYINQLRNKGIEIHEAIVQAAKTRLRPVLITALTTILGMIPMALSTSEGAEMRAPMAITVIGGLVTTTILTLVIIPTAYSIVDRISFKTSEQVMGAIHNSKSKGK
jgi:HAE1 family hydrophobic/amphiphilic exporter-1